MSQKKLEELIKDWLEKRAKEIPKGTVYSEFAPTMFLEDIKDLAKFLADNGCIIKSKCKEYKAGWEDCLRDLMKQGKI